MQIVPAVAMSFHNGLASMMHLCLACHRPQWPDTLACRFCDDNRAQARRTCTSSGNDLSRAAFLDVLAAPLVRHWLPDGINVTDFRLGQGEGYGA